MMNKQSFVILALSALLVSTFGCSSMPRPSETVKGEIGSAEGQWRGKALVRNLKNKKSATLDLDLLAHEPDRLRIEALGPLGVHIASIAAKENEVRISLTREKKFIIAASDRNALARIIPVRVAPADLLAVLFDRPLEGTSTSWRCNYGKKPSFVCEAGKAKIERFNNEEGRRKYKMTAPEAEMDLILTEAPVNTALGETAYALEASPGQTVEDRR